MIFYAKGSLILVTILLTIFMVWRFSGFPLSVKHINTFKVELLYWTAILFSNTLGTAFGDFLADNSGLGFAGGALLIGSLLLVVIVATYSISISRVFLFWVAFVLTRPFGATMGDFLTKSYQKGGLNFGTIGSSEILGTILLTFVIYATLKTKRTETIVE